jgi:hypothetical protein
MRCTRVAVLLAALVAAGVVPGFPAAGRAEEASQATQVEIRLAVRGEIFAPAGDDAPPVREPIDLEARFEFNDLPVAGEGGSRRRYRAAAATVTVGEQRHHHALAADARDVLVALEGTTPTPALADGFLSRQEAELLDIPFDPLLIDSILAGEPRTVLARWRVPGDIVAGLLAIDTVTGGGLDVVLAEVTGHTARRELEGTVHGGVDGVATRISVTGTARVPCAAAAATPDRWLFSGRIERLEATLAEQQARLDTDDPDTLITAVNVAFLRDRQEGHGPVRTRPAADDLEQVLGPVAPEVLTAWHDVGHLLLDAGAVEDARHVLTDVLERRTQLLGAEHPDTRVTADELAFAAERQAESRRRISRDVVDPA